MKRIIMRTISICRFPIPHIWEVNVPCVKKGNRKGRVCGENLILDRCAHTHAYCKLVFLELTNSLTKDILYDLFSCVVKCSKADQLLLTEWVVLVYRTIAQSKKIMAFRFIEQVFLDIISIPNPTSVF